MQKSNGTPHVTPNSEVFSARKGGLAAHSRLEITCYIIVNFIYLHLREVYVYTGGACQA